jgi:hypothetical protein
MATAKRAPALSQSPDKNLQQHGPMLYTITDYR